MGILLASQFLGMLDNIQNLLKIGLMEYARFELRSSRLSFLGKLLAGCVARVYRWNQGNMSHNWGFQPWYLEK